MGAVALGEPRALPVRAPGVEGVLLEGALVSHAGACSLGVWGLLRPCVSQTLTSPVVPMVFSWGLFLWLGCEAVEQFNSTNIYKILPCLGHWARPGV